MRSYTWAMLMVGGSIVEVHAIGLNDAIILCFAERIKQGLHTDCHSITNVDKNDVYKGPFKITVG